MYTVHDIYVPDVKIVESDEGMDDPDHLRTLLGGEIYSNEDDEKSKNKLLEEIIR